VPQLIVVDQVLVAERDAEHPLRHHRLDRMLDLRLHPAVVEAGGEPRHQADRAIGRPEQQRPGVRRDLATIERSYHLAAFDHFITEQVAATLCQHRGTPPIGFKSFRQKDFRRFGAPMHLFPVRNPD
jgi:hypothetical protein